MRRRITAAALVLAALALTGCAADTSGTPVDSAPAPAERSLPLRDPRGLFETKPVVEGTELICVRDDTNGSTTCNWGLWNKTREPPR